MTDTITVERLLEALRCGWEGHKSPLVDEEWCWMSEVRDPSLSDGYGPTYRVHRVHCTRFGNPNTTYLRPIRTTDPVEFRCDNCKGSSS